MGYDLFLSLHFFMINSQSMHPSDSTRYAQATPGGIKWDPSKCENYYTVLYSRFTIVCPF